MLEMRETAGGYNAKYPLVDPEQINNYVKYKKYYLYNVEMLNRIAEMNYEKFGNTVTMFKDAYLKNMDRYKILSEKTGIPSELIAVIHYRENSKDYLEGTFNCYLHNGQILGNITTMEPKDKFFTDFDEAAIDAITTKLNSVPLPFGENTDIATMLTFAESYNGFGYANNEYVNPYLYSGTNIYVSGKYVEDHMYDPSAVDNQVGTYILLYSIINDNE